MSLLVSDIRFAYRRRRPALRGVSFSLQPGEALAVLGKNGAGKSTLIKCLNRILEPQGGAVRIDGEEVSRLDREEIARRFGYVPQGDGRGGLTVFETVLTGRKPRMGWGPGPRDFEAVEEALAALGLTALARRPLAELSGGERQKAVLARALVQEPKILLLDEPTSNLDLKNQIETLSLVRREMRRRGLAAVIALHDLNLAFRFADRFLFLKDGKARACLPREEVDPELIEEVYEIRVAMSRVNGFTVVTPIAPLDQPAEEGILE